MSTADDLVDWYFKEWGAIWMDARGCPTSACTSCKQPYFRGHAEGCRGTRLAALRILPVASESERLTAALRSEVISACEDDEAEFVWANDSYRLTDKGRAALKVRP